MKVKVVEKLPPRLSRNETEYQTVIFVEEKAKIHHILDEIVQPNEDPFNFVSIMNIDILSKTINFGSVYSIMRIKKQYNMKNLGDK
ncbi:hypothetical protein QJS10_CPA16g00593 [Acorus calamus]|uniref:Uncharacterized protein n=1 Tax=Acorus calamus TaxID=4465 RepID=A0AAV9CZ27_ACOCL|nr:hypothetical protein QJS10_CPA16g00593 [Acorus calamus]